MSEESKCELCGEPMPPGEGMFKFHGYSGPCPKPPITRPETQHINPEAVKDLLAACEAVLGFRYRLPNELVLEIESAITRAKS